MPNHANKNIIVNHIIGGHKDMNRSRSGFVLKQPNFDLKWNNDKSLNISPLSKGLQRCMVPGTVGTWKS